MDSSVVLVPCVIGLLVSFLLSCFFSIVKVVFLSIDKNSLPADNERLRSYAAKIEDIQEKRAFLNSTVSFGKTLANTAFAAFAYTTAFALLPSLDWYQSLIAACAFSVVVLSVFAYVVPRALALRFNVEIAPATYLVFSFFHALFYFFSAGLTAVQSGMLKILGCDERFAFLSHEEKSRMSGANGSREGLDEDEKEMIHSIFELGETTAEEIMTPRIEVKGLDVDTDFDTVLAAIREAGHSRIPVYIDTIDTILGILYAKDMLGWVSQNKVGDFQLRSLLKKAHFVPMTKKIDDLMGEFKKKQIHMGIVVDEFGGTAGIVTLEDILEEIVGEIQDEYDEEEQPIVQISPNVYHIDPRLDLDDLAEELNVDLDLEDAEYNTLGGLIYHEVGDVPKENAVIEHNGLKLKVLEMDGHRIEKVQVEVVRHRIEDIGVNESF